MHSNTNASRKREGERKKPGTEELVLAIPVTLTSKGKTTLCWQNGRGFPLGEGCYSGGEGHVGAGNFWFRDLEARDFNFHKLSMPPAHVVLMH